MQMGRVFALFEILGTPEGFDVVAGTAELGGTVPVGTTLHVDLPRVRGLDPALPVPTVRARVIYISPSGAVTTVADVTGEPSLDVELTTIGAYRVEISIVPRHLGPYLGDLGTELADRELPWIYASPIYVD
jgi:hypothetical protein